MSRSTFRYGPNMNGGKPKKKSKGTPLLSTENVIDMDLGVLRDKEVRSIRLIWIGMVTLWDFEGYLKGDMRSEGRAYNR